MENSRNQKKRSDNSTGFKGVSWVKREKRFLARIGIRNKVHNIGLFRTAEEAAAAYKAAAEATFGEFVRRDDAA